MSQAFNHFGLTVSNLDESLAFYRLLGFEPTDGPQGLELAGGWVDEATGLQNVRMKIAFVALDERVLELIEYQNPVGNRRTTVGLPDAGSAHIAVTVDDVHREYERLKAAGVDFVGEPVRAGEGDLAGVVVVFGNDPDGNKFELVSNLG